MYKFTLGFLGLLSICALSSFALHEYFFGFAEMEYNSEDKKFEISIQTTAHDFEHHMEHMGVELGHIEKLSVEDSLFQLALEEINNGFRISKEGKALDLKCIGFEVNLKDELFFYLQSETTDKSGKWDIEFDLMMNSFPKQQNKLNYVEKGAKTALTFLFSNKERTLEIK
ncbi:hypothetical protein SAMN05216474_1282 [Lishizhenia tianjinensis]|uniref:Uncharacterized protein n=1 Tax=Lishizhenia tianjinensis TaxID=477690 RepID=A0A1I6YY49_9FLAO|nr:DUF6702 family protein [Lishizhenia tianjinensis]SFT55377.1 hypothetical protein SAMN05216474_1282 [Lishizhenia tianjinensis]